MEQTENTRALGTDEATASVRPADARYNRNRFTPEQLAEIREQEIEEATVALLEQRKAEEEKNQEALDVSGYVNPTVQPEESPVAKAFDKVYGSSSGDSGDSGDSSSSSSSSAAGKKAAAKSSASGSN